MLYCFLDTNVFMHFQMFDEVDWPKLLDAEEVCLIIPRKVIQQLDKHKYDPTSNRRQNRARKVLKKIESISETADSVVRERTRLQIQTTAPVSQWLRDRGYDPGDSDDCIVGAVQWFIEQNPDAQTILIADDYGARLKAKAQTVKINSIAPPASIRLPDEPDPLQKENQQLKQQLMRLQNAQPELSLGFELENGSINEEIRFTIDFSDEEITPEELEQNIEAKRKQLKYRSSRDDLQWNDSSESPPFAGVGGFDPFTIHPSAEEIAQYERRVESYLGEYREYLHYALRAETYEARTRQLNLVLGNEGSKPAEDIDIWMHFPYGLVLAAFHQLRPEAPSPPEMPRPKRRGIFDNAFNNMLKAFTLPVSSNAIDLISPHVIGPSNDESFVTGPNIQKKDGYEAGYSVYNLKHHHNQPLNPLFITFDPPEKLPKVFEVEYQITAANVVNMIEGKLRIRLDE